MKIAGANVLHAPVDRAWDALLDPAVLVATIPGCERLVATGDNAYDMTVTAGVAAIKGTYAGTCVLSDLDEPRSLVMALNGAGAPGTIGATVNVGFADGGDGTTTVTWDADAVVGGMVGGVGQRMLTSVSKRMAGEFFGNVDRTLSGETLPAVGAAPGSSGSAVAGGVQAGQVFTAPPSATGISSQTDFVKGIAVGAGLVLLGVIAGSLFGRRR
jgi:carbon monoxide dehydrogenase subunit G